MSGDRTADVARLAEALRTARGVSVDDGLSYTYPLTGAETYAHNHLKDRAAALRAPHA